MNSQAYILGYLQKQAKKKKKKEPWTESEKAEFKAKHGKSPNTDWGVSFFKDDKGYFCTTHRARSKSKPSPAKITKKELDFVRSTG